GLVHLGIEGDRIQENVLSHHPAEKLVYLREPRRLERALVLATGIGHISRHGLALEQLVVETNARAVLRGQRDVRKIVRTPAIPCKCKPDMQKDERGEQRRRHASSVTPSHFSTGRLDWRYW